MRQRHTGADRQRRNHGPRPPHREGSPTRLPLSRYALPDNNNLIQPAAKNALIDLVHVFPRSFLAASSPKVLAAF